MKKYGNITIEDCDFNYINSLCYEPGICKMIHFNNTDFTDEEAVKRIKSCTWDINEASSITKGSIIIGCSVIVLICTLTTILLINKKKSEKYNKYLLNLLLNNKTNEINENNNNEYKNDDGNDNDNDNNDGNNNNDNNYNDNYVRNDIMLSNNNHQESLNMGNPPSYDESNVVIYTNDDNDNNNNNNNNNNDNDNNVRSDVALSNDNQRESLNMGSPPSYNENNVVIYSNDDNEQLPEYSEFNRLIEQQ